MVYRCKKCNDILNVTALFTSMEHWAKRLFVRFWKDGLLAKLKARMSWGRRFLPFLKHRCLVTLTLYKTRQIQFDFKLFPLSKIAYLCSSVLVWTLRANRCKLERKWQRNARLYRRYFFWVIHVQLRGNWGGRDSKFDAPRRAWRWH